MRCTLLLLLAACGHSSHDHHDVDAAAPSPDATSMTPDAAPDAPAGFVIPPMDLGTITVAGTCTDVYRGWSFNDATGCTPDDRTSMGPSSRQITIASDGSGGYQLTTTFRYDALEHLWYDPYTVDVSQAQPSASQKTPATCNPIYGTCIDHEWQLTAHSLVLHTDYLHDNSSGTPLPQCWEYYYDRTDCTFELDW